jgi:hypothetical protein
VGPSIKSNKGKKCWLHGLSAEHLPSKRKALSSSPRGRKKKNKTKICDYGFRDKEKRRAVDRFGSQ